MVLNVFNCSPLSLPPSLCSRGSIQRRVLDFVYYLLQVYQTELPAFLNEFDSVAPAEALHVSIPPPLVLAVL